MQHRTVLGVEFSGRAQLGHGRICDDIGAGRSAQLATITQLRLTARHTLDRQRLQTVKVLTREI